MTVKLLDWQKECVDKFIDTKYDAEYRNFVIYAGTGSGKTIAGSQCVYDHLCEYGTDLCIVAVPYRAIKNGWADALRRYGLEVAAKPTEIANDTSVIVTTYGGAPSVIHYVTREMPSRRILFVFDEFHHLEETNSWAGTFINFPDNRVSRRILLSGTPWRENGNIPDGWVKYDENDEIIAHVRHTYGDNVNAPDDEQRNTVSVKFKPIRVHGVERVYKEDGTQEDAPYDSDKTRRSDSMSPFVRFSDIESLRDRQGLRELLHNAVDQLSALRLRNPLVGGIVFVQDRHAGKAVQHYLEELGRRAVLITSDDSLAHKQLQEFRENPMMEWLVAIDMVSEGVDIPRLRVVADLTNRATLMHIIQRWGRVLRRLRDRNRIPVQNDCDAYIFFIKHAQLQYVADEIEKDVRTERREENGTSGDATPPTRRQIETLTHNGEWKDATFKGVHIEDQIERVADWILTVDFNGVRTARLGLNGAINLAQYMVNAGAVPEEFFRDKTDFNIPSDPPPVPESKDDVVAEYTKISNHIMMRGFLGNHEDAMAAINFEHGVSSWKRDNKTMEQLCKRRDACKRVYLRCFGEVWGDRA